ncbi:stage II sporulation protein R [Paenibacillus turpanensis]|uniref:stage II sporulation protein R n=1 Tax=Paenibacillus turpanensis TaxID=2689078 RepID=UPI001FB5ADE7|nr:stage II sporulation protein R [Paenibacillus turpanensis]
MFHSNRTSNHTYNSVEFYPRRQKVSSKMVTYLAFLLVLLIMSWESHKVNAAVAAPSIPQESIRLRILANSDSPTDQLVKRAVRDEIVKEMNQWVKGPETLEEARAIVAAHLPELEAAVARVLEQRGFNYTYQVELGQIDFPTKMYGNEMYPAGKYEAVLVTLGNGEGQNWWCVLFPPLCFVDIVSGDKKKEEETKVEKSEEQTPAGEKGSKTASAKGDSGKVVVASAQADAEPEVRFFVVELFQKLGGFVKSLFA